MQSPSSRAAWSSIISGWKPLFRQHRGYTQPPPLPETHVPSAPSQGVCARMPLEVPDATVVLPKLQRPEPHMQQQQVFEVKGFVAAGGMGRVFYALRHLPGLPPQPVAIKRMRHDVPEPQELEAGLWREGEVGLWLHHPNIVQTLDVLTVPVGSSQETIVVLEWVEGPTLKTLMEYLHTKGQWMTPAMATHLIIQAAEGLSHAVSTTGPSGKPLALIHRDLKPSNLMLTRQGQVKIMDFGIARYDGRTMLTGHGLFKGSIDYAAPEVLLMLGDELIPAADVYSLGLIYYRLLTGKPLVAFREPADYFRFIPHLNAAPIIRALPDALNPLKATLNRMLRRLPHARFADPWELAFTLRELLPLLPGAETVEQDLATLCQQVHVSPPHTDHIELDRHAYLPPLLVPSPYSPVTPAAEHKSPSPAVRSSLLPPLLMVGLVLLNLVLLGIVWERLLNVERPEASAHTRSAPLELARHGQPHTGLVEDKTSMQTSKPTPINAMLQAPDVAGSAAAGASKGLQAGSGARLLRLPSPNPVKTSVSATREAPGETKTALERREHSQAEKQAVLRTPTTALPSEGAERATPAVMGSVASANEAQRPQTGSSAAAESTGVQTGPSSAPPSERSSLQKQELTLTSIPLGSFYVNGRKVSHERSVKMMIFPGTYEIMLQLPDGVTQSFTLRVEPGEGHVYRWYAETQRLEIIRADR
ncbi:MAG: serine/threonine-protein kinase [Myxococcota bacterium]